MVIFSQEKVLLLHQIIIGITGGDSSLRDVKLLNSALNNPFQTFEGKDLYPTKEEKAAAIGYSLINNHPFVDGNKRIGMHVMVTFLLSNGIKIKATNKQIETLGFKIASGKANYEEVLIWIKKREFF